MMEGLTEALQYIAGLKSESEKAQVVSICGKTYANKKLVPYGAPERAQALRVSTLTALVDYIRECSSEFPAGRKMILHIVTPGLVRLMTELDAERSREILLEATAKTSDFRFDSWYSQERLMIEMQANFMPCTDRDLILKFAGNVEKKNNQTFSDDGVTQVATMSVGAASKSDVIVPNPVTLYPYRTFLEVQQPGSQFVFRLRDGSNGPEFSLIEAEGGLWELEAIGKIKVYLAEALCSMPGRPADKIVIIG